MHLVAPTFASVSVTVPAAHAPSVVSSAMDVEAQTSAGANKRAADGHPSPVKDTSPTARAAPSVEGKRRAARSLSLNSSAGASGSGAAHAEELRRLRRAIIDGKMSPCYPGREDASGANDTVLEECPICFLHYPSLNRSRYAPARERHPPVGGTSFRPGGSRRRDRAGRARRAPGAGAPSSDA